uniref:Uncharacterized protein n=1 Tax=Anguilla anguilla TaxID=7936 RepID=A0A0E9VJ14_ANGAN
MLENCSKSVVYPTNLGSVTQPVLLWPNALK